MLDGHTGAQLAGSNVHKRSLIASTTKIMTAVVVLETMDPHMTITIPKEAVGIEGSSVYLKEGESMKVIDLLYGLMLHSGNDAAVALAIGACGSVAQFVLKMNERANALSLQNTHFENPHGLDGGNHYSSAYDLAVLTAYALKDPIFRQIVACKEITVGCRSLRNHNRLLWMMDGVIGVKTGYTKAAGRILVSAYEFNDRILIAVTINDGNDWQDHISLYDYGKSLYTCCNIFEKDDYIGQMPLCNGRIAALYGTESFSAYLREGECPVFNISYPVVPMGQSGIACLNVYVGHLYLGRVYAKWEERIDGKNSKTDCLPGRMLSPQG